MTLQKTLDMAAAFRTRHPDTPLILMGYFNPIYIYGQQAFITAAKDAGVDGLIIVDLPPEEDEELCDAAIDGWPQLYSPGNAYHPWRRLSVVVKKAGGGFVYYVAIAGITGTKSAATDSIKSAFARLRGATDLPAVAGFGIRSADQAAEVAAIKPMVPLSALRLYKKLKRR